MEKKNLEEIAKQVSGKENSLSSTGFSALSFNSGLRTAWRMNLRILSFLNDSWSSLLAPLCAISTRFLCAVVVVQNDIAAIGRRAFRHLSRHCQPYHLQPALLKLLTFGCKVVEGLGLREAEAGWRVRRPGNVIHRITQEGYSTLGLHVLRRVARDGQVAV